ncbi:MAG: SDR family oxidoreductase [Chloroflexota bacterium]
MRALDSRVVIVTGASEGIGHSISRLFAREGANVVAVARNSDRLADLKLQTVDCSGEVRTVVGDVRDEDTAQRSIHQALAGFGRLDILIINAEVAIFRPIWELSVQDYDDMMDTNMRSAFTFARAAVKPMMEQRSGMIVNIGSLATAGGGSSGSAYRASMCAQLGFAQALDEELRDHDIKVISILSGGVAPGHSAGNGPTPEGIEEACYRAAQDVAHAVLFTVTQPATSRILEVRMRPTIEIS